MEQAKAIHSYMVDKQEVVDIKREIMQMQLNLEESLENETTSAYLAYHEHGIIQATIKAVKRLKLFETAIEESIVLEKQIKLTSLIMELKDREDKKNALQGRQSE